MTAFSTLVGNADAVENVQKMGKNVGINKFLNLSKFHVLQYLAFQCTRTFKACCEKSFSNGAIL